ncbi:MAG TPA: choice-of-anchor tandem repeat GloVer-containing protein [Stellaceae bacterium]|jgi:uncharacterized repeat protein (TIGR03803 family)|nr:choice-of-anchor tandem repeat GloVer-containing protein [Stellaceae bacterium]
MKNLQKMRMRFAAAAIFVMTTVSAAAAAPKLTTLHQFAGGKDGGNPQSVLLSEGGTLYGTTEAGGASGAGTVFEIDPDTAKEKVLFSFGGGKDGGTPTGRGGQWGGRGYAPGPR